MSAGEKDIAAIKKKYETEIQSLEAEMDQMQREKDNLTQMIKSDPVSSKLSEQRRKRIQELELSIQVRSSKIVGSGPISLKLRFIENLFPKNLHKFQFIESHSSKLIFR